MRYEDDGLSLLFKVFQRLEAFLLEGDIAHSQGFIDEQDIRVNLGRDGKTQSDIHTSRIGLYRGVDKITNIRKGDDGIHLLVDLFSGQAQDGAIEVDVLPTGQFLLKASAQLQKSHCLAINVNSPLAWLGYPA